MKKMLVVGLLLPFIAMSQPKVIITSTRVFAKPDKIAEFEKALAAHAHQAATHARAHSLEVRAHG